LKALLVRVDEEVTEFGEPISCAYPFLGSFGFPFAFGSFTSDLDMLTADMLEK